MASPDFEIKSFKSAFTSESVGIVSFRKMTAAAQIGSKINAVSGGEAKFPRLSVPSVFLIFY